MSGVNVRMLCTFHGEYPPDRLHACPLCRDELVERVERAEAQLAVVPALVEALRKIRSSGFAKTGVSGYPEKYAKGDYRLEALAEIADSALSKWEQAQGETP